MKEKYKELNDIKISHKIKKNGIEFIASDNKKCYAKSSFNPELPTVLFFDGEEKVGYHYLRRFGAIGYNVIHINHREEDGQTENTIQTILDGLLMTLYIRKISNKKIVTMGENRGGSIAILVATISKDVEGCIAQSPIFSKEKIINPLFYIAYGEFTFVLGSGKLDKISIIEDNLDLIKKFKGQKYHYIYPKYEHERINDYEDKKMMHLTYFL